MSEAVDFARYYAATAREARRDRGGRVRPGIRHGRRAAVELPARDPAGGVLAALAAGSGVVFKPAPQARRCAAVIAETLWQAGIPRDLLALVDIEEGELGRELITHDAVDRVILTGAWDTAPCSAPGAPTLPLLAETSGKNAMIITPSADLDLAVADLVKSAFGHAGQKCSAASLDPRRPRRPFPAVQAAARGCRALAARGPAHRSARRGRPGDRAAAGQARLGAERARG